MLAWDAGFSLVFCCCVRPLRRCWRYWTTNGWKNKDGCCSACFGDWTVGPDETVPVIVHKGAAWSVLGKGMSEVLAEDQQLGLDKDVVDVWCLQHPNATELDLSEEQFAVLPESLGALKLLETLNLWNCWKLTRLPQSLGKLVALERLYLYGCKKLTSLPESLKARGAKPDEMCSLGSPVTGL